MEQDLFKSMNMGYSCYSCSIEESLEKLQPGSHLSMIYDTEQEWMSAIIPFLKIGLKRGQKCIYIIDSRSPEQILNYLREQGVDTDQALAKGQLSIARIDQLLSGAGACGPEQLLEFLDSETNKALSEGYPALWVTCDKTCFYSVFADESRLLEFEAKLNRDFFGNHKCVAVCQFERKKFNPEIIKGVILTHPLLILGNRVYRNFYYVPAEELLSHKEGERQVMQWLSNIKSFNHQFYFLQELIDSIPTPVCYKDKNGVYLGCNQAFAELMKLPRENIIGKTISEILPDELGLQFDAMDQELFANPGIQTYEWKIEYEDGSFRNIIVNKALFHNPDGEVAGLVGVIFDITERKKAEEALRQSELKYRLLIENAADGIFTLNPEGIVVDVNPAGLKMLGYSREELLGRNVMEFVKDDREQIRSRIESAENGAQSMFRTHLLKKDGSMIPVEINAQKRHDKFFQSFVRDLSEKIKMEEELAKIDRLNSLAMLAGGIAHDFNNILMAIQGNLSLVKMNLAPDSQAFEDISDAEKACERARDLTKQLSTFARGGAPIKELTGIGNLLRESANFVLRGSNCKPEFQIAQDLWSAELDPGQMSQVINNLLINATQAMPQGGTIKIRAQNVKLTKEMIESGIPLSEGDYIKIEIQDQGEGIAEENLEKIFDPFFTTKSGRKGLGLAVCFSIVKKHNGYIKAESSPGKGTTFIIYLPASAKKVETKAEDTSERIKGKARVLLMDDEPMVRKVGKRMLESLGYEVEAVEDGKIALEYYQVAKEVGTPFDLVIMDLTVPGGMGGEEAIKKLREIDPEVKALVSSGYSDKPIMADYQRYGFSGVITKPYEIKGLSAVMDKLMNQNSN